MILKPDKGLEDEAWERVSYEVHQNTIKTKLF